MRPRKRRAEGGERTPLELPPGKCSSRIRTRIQRLPTVEPVVWLLFDCVPPKCLFWVHFQRSHCCNCCTRLSMGSICALYRLGQLLIGLKVSSPLHLCCSSSTIYQSHLCCSSRTYISQGFEVVSLAATCCCLLRLPPNWHLSSSSSSSRKSSSSCLADDAATPCINTKLPQKQDKQVQKSRGSFVQHLLMMMLRLLGCKPN